MGRISIASLVRQWRLAHQGHAGLESGSVEFAGVELHSGEKHCCLIKALKALCLAFSTFSSSVSFSICTVSFLIRSLSLMICSLSLLSRTMSLSSCSGFAGLRLHPQLVLHLSPLVVGIPTPVQHR
ncbi:MAG: hypothetical protein ACK46L_10730 [Synechococcaceae cyanobacterium]